MRSLLSTLALLFLLNGQTSAILRDTSRLSPPKALPFKCNNARPPLDCSKQQLCINRSCGPGYRCVESYCGSCEAKCVRTHGTKSCNKMKKLSPVCGRDGKIYASPCHARRAGVKTTTWVRCSSAGGGCRCDLEYEPVCGDNKRYYINKCVAHFCAKTGFASWSNCDPQIPNPDCFCPYIYDPVCGVNGVTYSNACEAACYNVEVKYDGQCTETCKALHSECELRKQECCEGLMCAGYPVMHINMTHGRCWDRNMMPPIG